MPYIVIGLLRPHYKFKQDAVLKVREPLFPKLKDVYLCMWLCTPIYKFSLNSFNLM